MPTIARRAVRLPTRSSRRIQDRAAPRRARRSARSSARFPIAPTMRLTSCTTMAAARASRPSSSTNFGTLPKKSRCARKDQRNAMWSSRSIAFGDIAIVTNPAELFSIYGARSSRRHRFKVTFVAELSNGYCGYVPTLESFTHGGYETYRTVYTSRLAKDGGERILERSRSICFERSAHVKGHSG